MESSPESDFVIKILLLGDSEVGKSCFLMRYSDNVFVENYITTIGLDYKLKTVKLDSGKTIKVQLCDTAGQDKYRTIAKNYYKGSHGILLLYDITKITSFENIREWIRDIKEEVSEKAIIFLIGNKIDLTDNRKISKEKGEELAEEYKIPFFEASAKSGENVDEVFKALYKKISEVYGDLEREKGSKLNKKNKNKGICCI
jgi:Ras-related protein Rab-1A